MPLHKRRLVSRSGYSTVGKRKLNRRFKNAFAPFIAPGRTAGINQESAARLQSIPGLPAWAISVVRQSTR
jgi:hypothetical protein